MIWHFNQIELTHYLNIPWRLGVVEAKQLFPPPQIPGFNTQQQWCIQLGWALQQTQLAVFTGGKLVWIKWSCSSCCIKVVIVGQFCYFASFSYNNLDAQQGLQDTWGTIGNWQTEIGTLPWIGTLALVEELENLSDPEIRLRTIHSPPYWGLGMTTSSLKTN